MTPEAIADRLVNFADAIAAFSVVNSLAFLVTLGDPEIRCSIANALWLVVGGHLAFGVAYAMAVAVLRSLEIAMRGTTPVTPEIGQFLRGFFIARLAVIALFTLFTSVSAALALANPGCAAPG